MEKQGYIKLYRKIIDWEWYDDNNTFKLFIHLLLKVNHESKSWRGEEIKRGSCITSLASLSAETGLTIQEIRTSLKHLKSTQEVTSITTNKNTLLIVLNYDLYQDSNTVSNIQATNNQQTTNKQLTTNKNVKNVKNDKNNTLKDIVEYLNLKTGKSFKATSKQTIEHINARLDEGFTVDDFKKVIDVKTGQWKNDKKMNGFLRPQTLFSPSKFESYLNEGDTNETSERVVINGITQV